MYLYIIYIYELFIEKFMSVMHIRYVYNNTYLSIYIFVCMYVYTYIYIHAFIYTWDEPQRLNSLLKSLWALCASGMYITIFIYLCMHLFVCMYLCVYICVYIYVRLAIAIEFFIEKFMSVMQIRLVILSLYINGY
jgi:hypothetical protein